MATLTARAQHEDTGAVPAVRIDEPPGAAPVDVCGRGKVHDAPLWPTRAIHYEHHRIPGAATVANDREALTVRGPSGITFRRAARRDAPESRAVGMDQENGAAALEGDPSTAGCPHRVPLTRVSASQPLC